MLTNTTAYPPQAPVDIRDVSCLGVPFGSIPGNPHPIVPGWTINRPNRENLRDQISVFLGILYRKTS